MRPTGYRAVRCCRGPATGLVPHRTPAADAQGLWACCGRPVSLFRNPRISYEGLHNHLTPVLLLRQEMGRTGIYSRYVVICLRGEFGGAMGEVGEVLAGDGELRGPIRPLYIVIKVPTRISLGNTPIPICVRGAGCLRRGREGWRGMPDARQGGQEAAP